jgi:hypothetical protein
VHQPDVGSQILFNVPRFDKFIMKRYAHNRLWRPIGLRYVQAPTFPRTIDSQSAARLSALSVGYGMFNIKKSEWCGILNPCLENLK